jgi:hypothetical protein
MNVDRSSPIAKRTFAMGDFSECSFLSFVEGSPLARTASAHIEFEA